MKDYPCTVTSPCGHQMAVTQTEGLLRVSLSHPSQTAKLAAAVKKIDTQWWEDDGALKPSKRAHS